MAKKLELYDRSKHAPVKARPVYGGQCLLFQRKIITNFARKERATLIALSKI